jgi:L-fuconolactonase
VRKAWRPPDKIYRTLEVADVLAAGADAGLESVVLIESGTSEEENEWLSQVAGDPAVLSFVAYADPLAEDFDHTVERWTGSPKLRGFRFRLEGIHGPEVLAEPRLMYALSALEQKSLLVELLVEPLHLRATAESLRAVPRLTAVVEHLAKPRFDAEATDDERQEWRNGMAAIAKLPATVCKLSLSPRAESFGEGTFTAEPWDSRRIGPWVRFAYEQFGPRRCCWGSDWPISGLLGDYGDIVLTMQSALGPVSGADREAVFHGNALRIYDPVAR